MAGRPRLRYFEQSAGQAHIGPEDRYLYRPPGARHRINVIGTGTIGQEHMRVASILGRATIHGIYDVEPRSLDAAEANHAASGGGKLVRYADLDAACSDSAADALIIATPNFTHADVLEAAAASGKPILLEKPMATTLADAARIVELSRTYPSFFQVGLQYRFKSIYVEARHEALDRRSIGAIQTIAMVEHRPPFLDKVAQWNKFERCSGGTLVEKCCHYFDLMNLFAGARAKRVFASAGQAVNFLDFERDGQKSDIADHGFVIVEYENGLRASLSLAMFCPGFYEELVLCGDNGRLKATETFDFQRTTESRSTLDIEHGEEGATRHVSLAYPSIIERSGHHGATFFEHAAFLDNIEGKPTVSATVDEGFWSIVVGVAAQRSQQTGEPVSITELLAAEGVAGIADR